MTVHDLFELVNYISGRHTSGAAITPARFNILLPQCSVEFYDSLWRKALLEGLSPHSPLEPFVKTATLTAQNGVATLPVDYADHLKAQLGYSAGGNTGSARKSEIDIVNDYTFRQRQSSVMTRGYIKPFARILGGVIEVVPNDIEDIEFDYLRLPLAPVMDYCQSEANPNLLYFMPAGSYITDVDGVMILYDVNDNIIQSGVTKNISYLPYTSKTVELEWNDLYHPHLMYRVLVKAGVNLSEQLVTQYAMEAGK